MRLPQRTPWSSLAELDQVCSWVYSDPSDSGARLLAIQRLSAWRAITALPHALESLLSLLVAIAHDEEWNLATSSLSLRQSYAASIIRLVNGLVDPLQVGAYARSIASIAAQLGLPAWLVELRHAATHEELPSLELLREAARESLDWLLHNYLLPTLNSSPAKNLVSVPVRPLGSLLSQYKSLLKTVTRDTSLASHYQPEIERTLRDVERWIAEIKVGMEFSADDLGWGGGTSSDQGGREALALEALCDELVKKGALVPVSRKKRIITKGQLLPPPALAAIWAPLLESVESHHPAFPSTLLSRIVSRLLPRPRDSPGEYDDPPMVFDTSGDQTSYELCLAGWAMWLARSRDDGSLDASQAKKEAFIMLAISLGPQSNSVDANLTGARALLTSLCVSDPHLDAVSKAILLSFDPETLLDGETWRDDDMTLMDERLEQVLAVQAETSYDEGSGASKEPSTEPMPKADLPQGWDSLSTTLWRPCPIGIYAAAR